MSTDPSDLHHLKATDENGQAERDTSGSLGVTNATMSSVADIAGNPRSIRAPQDILSIFRARNKDVDANKLHPFWDTQPVPKAKDELPSELVGPIDTSKRVADVRPEPYPLPPSFQWVTCDLGNDKELEEIYTLLNLNYVEDDDNMFRFDYSKSFLQWALRPPGYIADWHVGVRTDKGKLVAFITAIPAKISIYETPVSMVEINFLCVHKKLRSKRLAPVLIKEVTRRVNLHNVWQAVYTAGIVLTKPIAQCTYYHRSLNIKKLVEVHFTSLGARMTMSMAQKLYRLPSEPQTSGLRPMEKRDISMVLELLSNDFKNNTNIYPVFTEEEVAHTLLPKNNVIVSYVKESFEGKITDFFSFYILPSSVIQSEKHKAVNAAYCFYTVATSVSLIDLTRDALIVARNEGMDVFNALNLNRNSEFIQELKFGKGDGSLRYYLYNYLCPGMEPTKVGLIML